MTEPNNGGMKRMISSQTNLSFPSDGSFVAQSVSIQSQKIVTARDISKTGGGNGMKIGKGSRDMVLFSFGWYLQQCAEILSQVTEPIAASINASKLPWAQSFQPPLSEEKYNGKHSLAYLHQRGKVYC